MVSRYTVDRPMRMAQLLLVHPSCHAALAAAVTGQASTRHEREFGRVGRLIPC